MEEVQKERIREGKRAPCAEPSCSEKESSFFFIAAFKKRFPEAILKQMICWNQIYQEFLAKLSLRAEKKRYLHLLYWQELYFIWQQYNQNRALPNERKSADATFINAYSLLHQRHFNLLGLRAPLINDKEGRGDRRSPL